MSEYTDPLGALFEVSAGDPATWAQRLARLRQEYAAPATLRPVYVNDLRFGGRGGAVGATCVGDDPRAAFLDEWERRVRHRRLWGFARCNPAYEPRGVEALRDLESRQGVRVPPSLADFAARRHAHELIFHWQSTNNDFITPERWSVQMGPDDWWFVRVIDENQGCCFWYVAWRESDFDLVPPVFVGDYIDDALDEVSDLFARVECTVNHWSEFLYDYAVEGAKWYAANPEYAVDTSRYDRNAQSEGEGRLLKR